MKEQTRKDMQQKMADYQMAAPEVSWAEIERAVNKATIIPLWRKRIAIAAVIVLTIGGASLWWQWHQGQDGTQQTKKVAAVKENHELPILSEATAELTFHSTTKSITYTQTATPPMESSPITNENHQTESSEQPSEQADQRQPSPSSSHPAPSNNPTPTHSATKPAPADSRLTAKIYVSNAMNGYAGSTTFLPMTLSDMSFSDYTDKVVYSGNSLLQGSIPELKTTIRHHQPIRFGLSFRYDITDRWSIESGLSYTRHKSDITSQSGNYTTTVEQQLSYIGIPLNLSYRLWSSRRFSFYVSAGGMAEKMIAGSRSTSSTTENVSIRPLQFSLNGMAGAEFLIDKTFSLYMEPGLSYHFDNGSNVPTIYQDEPLNLNLNIGLRLSFK